jgi:hypothetical protein
MAFNFEVYQGTTLNDLGTVAQIVGKGGKMRFIAKNLASDKRVTTVLTKADGTSDIGICSETVSKGVRKALENAVPKNKVLSALSKLHALENEDGRQFISAPAGVNGEEEFTVEQLATVKNADYESVIAF